MQFQVRLLLVYLEQHPKVLANLAWPPLAVEELHSLTSLSARTTIPFDTLPLTASLLPVKKALKEGYLWKRKKDEWPKEHLLLLEGVVSCDLDVLKREWSGDPLPEDLAGFVPLMIAGDLEKFAGDLVLTSEIALPGVLNPTEIKCFIDGKVYWHKEPAPSIILDARSEFGDIEWPPLANLPLLPTLDWLMRIPGFTDGVPSGNVGRAVAALSHLIGHREESVGAMLMWAMIGLEALYVGGREGLSAQLRDKVQVLLGGPENKLKRFKILYDYRSKFIHGALDIPLAYTPYDAVDAFMKSEMDTYNAGLTGIALLVATLQKMVIEERDTLEFHWALGGGPGLGTDQPKLLKL